MNKAESNLKLCNGKFEIYNSTVFYPVPYWKWGAYFNPSEKQWVLDRLNRTRGAHLSSSLSAGGKVKVGRNNTAFEYIAQTYCPRVYSFLTTEL